MTVRDIDRGWNGIMRDLKNLDDSFTKVGVQQGETRQDGAETSDMVIVAAVNEFGTRTIPERPFMRNAFDKNKGKIKKVQDELYSRILQNRISPRQGLGLLGEAMERLTKKEITDLRTPPNAPATVAKKGSSNPLIDTGQLRQSITHVETIK